MDTCPHFNIWRKTIESREISRHRRNVQTKAPYCTHDESPAPLDLVTRVFGGGTILKCGGDIEKCQLPHGINPDLD